jgi:molecular chaperone HscB
VNATDHFTLLGLPRAFSVDPQVLDAAWKRVATAVHPDRFAAGSAAEKRVALQWSTQANEAWRILKDPLSRARYLCELSGVDLQTETNTAMAPAFLMQQMEWHEALEELASHPDPDSYRALTKKFDEARNGFVQTLTDLFEKQQFDQAAARVREWMFLDKLITQLKQTHGVTADL